MSETLFNLLTAFGLAILVISLGFLAGEIVGSFL